MDWRGISAFTRVFRRAMPGNDDLQFSANALSRSVFALPARRVIVPRLRRNADSPEVAAGETTSAGVRGNAMRQPARKEEPSMEEILASIRRMIAEEQPESPRSAPATSQPLCAAPATHHRSPGEPDAS